MNDSQSCPECELKETCSFFWNYRDHHAVRDSGILERYCRDAGASGGCERIGYYVTEGDYPPADLAPDGSRIQAQIQMPTDRPA